LGAFCEAACELATIVSFCRRKSSTLTAPDWDMVSELNM
jgi:hypothetical protein